MSQKTAVITGSNRGIGLELTRQLCEKGYHCYAFCRHSSPELVATSATVIDGVDVTDLESIQKGALSLPESIDLLINNAGILSNENLSSLDSEEGLHAIEHQFQVNTLGPLRVVGVLRHKLKRGSKIAMITSRMGSIDDNTSGSCYGYRLSKSALNSVSKSLSIDLKPEGVAVGIFHPGWVRTDMTGSSGSLDPNESAALLIQRIEELSIDRSGVFVHANGEMLPW